MELSMMMPPTESHCPKVQPRTAQKAQSCGVEPQYLHRGARDGYTRDVR